MTGELLTNIYKKIGVSPTNLTPVRNHRTSFTIDQAIAAANLFNVSLDWICGRTNERNIVSIPVRPELEALIEKKIKELLDKKTTP